MSEERKSGITAELLKLKKPTIKRQRMINSILVAILCASVLSILFSIGFASNVQLKFSDTLHGGTPPLNTIKIVAIDDKSIQDIGRWPWERTVFAKLVDRLAEGGASVVGVDVAFFEDSDINSDTQFADAMNEAGNVVIPVEYTRFVWEDGKVTGKGILLPAGPLNDAPLAKGYVNVITDRDGVTRAVNMDLSDEYHNLAYEVYKQYWGSPMTLDASRVLVNFIGPPGTFETYSFSDVINDRISPDIFKGAIVLVGATSPDLHDDYFVPTSVGKAMPGVEIHANTIQMLITKRFLEKASERSVILSIFILAIITSLLVYTLHVGKSALIMLGVWFGYIFFGISMFSRGVIMNFVYAPLTIILAYLATVVYYYLSEEKSKKAIEGAFGKYVSPVVIDHMLEHPERLNLGGERREITIFFSDIRGFTSISEKLKPEQLVELLNEYLSAMTEIIMKNNGVVDKYMGDAIMAFWGAPLPTKNHASLAAKTCTEMAEKLQELQKKWDHEGVPKLEIGIGLNTGYAVVGNMGSYDRFDYTAMGDTVNLGSRLEGINKQYGTRIIISESTNGMIKNQYVTRELDAVRVKGKEEPITIYELIRKKKDIDTATKQVVMHFERGLKLYKKQHWASAVREFESALRARKDDTPSKVFIERCRIFGKHPPGRDWDGVWTMKTK